MAIFRPFNGMRYTEKAGEIGSLCSPPYDVVSDAERKKLLKKNEYNIIRLELPKDKSDPYKKAKALLDDWYENGVLKCDEEPCMYVYGMHFSANGKEYDLKGVIGKTYLYDFDRNIILPHENTISKAKEDRFNLMDATCCNFSAIYALYEDEYGKIDRSVDRLSAREPDKSFTDTDGTVHRLWVVPRCDETDKISANLAGRKLFIADGHHRYETALKYRNTLRERGIIGEFGDNETDYIMMMIVNINSSGLVVFPTHRIIKDLANFNSAEVLTQCENYFNVTAQNSLDTALANLKLAYENGEKAFLMYDGKNYNLLSLKDGAIMKEVMEESSAALCELDVSVLQKLVLERIMGIDAQNLANGKNLVYTRDTDEAVSAVNDGADCCFILNPTRVEQIGAVAANSEKMPQKSTYFYPKLTTGLVMNKLDRVPPVPPQESDNGDANYEEPSAEIFE